jgi:hypothetical protein
MPTYSIFGWQKPCYLIQEGYADTFHDLMETTAWERYGYESGNPKCSNCMMHSGYEASTVDYAFGSLRGFLAMVKASLFSSYHDPDAARLLVQEKPRSPLVQIDLTNTPSQRSTLQGRQVSGLAVQESVEQALAYRGDLTLRLKDGRAVEGYLFDHEAGAVRMIVRTSGERVTVSLGDVEQMTFSGRDMATGKSWEEWVKKYLAKKAAGEQRIELAPEALD